MTSSRPRVPIALGSGSTNTEEGRAFFQNRLALFGGWVCLISGSFNLVIAAILVAIGEQFHAGMLFHLAGTLVAGGIWAIGRYGRLSLPAARALDVVGTLLICVSFAVMAGLFAMFRIRAGVDGLHELSVGVLACTYVLFARAIAVPSVPSRTAWISTAGMVPVMITAAYIIGRPEGAGRVEYIDVFLWATAAVPMAIITSRVIFGLRAEVSKVRQLGQYTLEEKIGEGGMGVVYRARHALLRRPTAIKLLAPERAGEENIHRFEREVQLTAGLSHPSTVAVFDYGRTPDGVFYYAMEYLDGTNLEQLVATDGPQPPGRVVHILQQVAGALAEAHDIGLVHRDVKPANIILCQRGGLPDVAKVVDFGLVKHFEANPEASTMRVTAAHMLMGTPLYMAPEAITGDSTVDGRSDLYSLGAVGYFLLTGTPLFKARTIVEMCAHHLHTPPERPSSRVSACPPSLERVILQCLAKSRNDRPADARSLLRALAVCARDAPWSEEDGAAWWAQFRQARPDPAPVAPAPESLTAVVDLANRVNQYR